VAGEQLLPLLLAECRKQLGGVDDVGEEERTARLQPPQQLLGTLLVEPRPEPFERGQRRLELRDCRMLVA
jgi:hypothetical protein